MTIFDDREPGHEPRKDALDRELDAVLHDLKQTYRVPRSAPPLDAMWSAIEGTLASAPQADVVPLRAVAGAARGRRFVRYTPWIGMAATLLIGVGIGRFTAATERPVSSGPASPVASTGKPVTGPTPSAPALVPPVVVTRPERLASAEESRGTASERPGVPAVATVASNVADEEYTTESSTSTNRYLGQTTALIVSLANDAPRPGDDARFARRARELLVTTRLMMDAPTTDEKSRALLEDLELVLTQIVRMQGEQGKQELKLIREALEQRDLLPRLYSAVVEGSDD